MKQKTQTFKKTLVTGGTGFIGKRLINFFIQNNHQFIVLTRSKKPLGENYVFLEDVNKIPENVFEGVDRVVHLAGISKDTFKQDEKTKKKYIEANINYVEKALKISIKKNVKSFNYISSIKVDEINTDFPLDDTNGFKKNQSIYALTKREAEKIVSKFSFNSQIKTNILRLSIVYGPESKGNLSFLTFLIKKGMRLKFPSLKNKKSFVHVDDVIKAIDFISINGNDGETYNISSAHYDLNQIIEIISKVYEKKYLNLEVSKKTLDFLSFIFSSRLDLFMRLKKEEIYSSNKLKDLGFSFSKTLYDINQSEF